MKWLVLLYLAVVLDVMTGLNLNLFGFGREPLWFAIGTVVMSGLLYLLGRYWLCMIALVLCCLWLLLYPAKNGFDAVLSPTLFLGAIVWLWRKYIPKK